MPNAFLGTRNTAANTPDRIVPRGSAVLGETEEIRVSSLSLQILRLRKIVHFVKPGGPAASLGLELNLSRRQVVLKLVCPPRHCRPGCHTRPEPSCQTHACSEQWVIQYRGASSKDF